MRAFVGFSLMLIGPPSGTAGVSKNGLTLNYAKSTDDNTDKREVEAALTKAQAWSSCVQGSYLKS